MSETTQAPSAPDTPIAELFARDPLDLSKQDIEAVVAHFRASRIRYVQGDLSAGSSKPKAQTKTSQDLEAKKIAKVTLSDLGL